MVLNTRNQKRRDFLSGVAGAGSLFLLGAAAGPVHAAGWVIAGADPVRKRPRVRVDNATVEDFSDVLGETFRLRQEDGCRAGAKLIEATALDTSGETRRRRQFSIVFDVPDRLALVQGQYRISHPRVGDMELFMVPVDLPARHNRLQAVFG